MSRGTVVAPGAFNALVARAVARAGFDACYISGGATANVAGYPDIGLISLSEMCGTIRQITQACGLPTIVDADTGYGEAESVARTVVEYERAARDSLARQNAYELDDKIWRAFGILSNARRISSEETQALLSPLRMGIHMQRFDKIDIPALNKLFLHSQPAHLQKLHGKPLDDGQRDVVRADFIRSRLSPSS